jgi:SulP family sulfate permease
MQSALPKNTLFSGLKVNSKSIMTDAVSGFATGLFSIPEGMAYAKLAGVNPLYGIYSGIVATIASSLSTGSILMISTLTSAIALSTASVMEAAGVQPDKAGSALFTITFLVGGIMFIMGLLRLGSVVGFVSNAVMTGFVGAASLLIIIGEMGDFSGYHPHGANKLLKMIDWFVNIDQWHGAVTAVGIATVAVMVIFKRFERTEKLAAIITLFLMTIVVNLIGLESVERVKSIATIPNSLPEFMLPDFSLMPKLAAGSLSVALVALIQGAGISTAYPNPDGSRAKSDRDFIGEGLGNLLGCFFQSMATGGSLSRTGISVGASTRWSGIFAGIWLSLIVFLVGSLAELVPLAVIAGMLFVIGAELILGRVPDAKLMLASSWGSVAAGALTFGSALFIPLQYTIFLGAGLSLLLYVYASSKNVKIRRLVRTDAGRYREQAVPSSYPANQITILKISDLEFSGEVPVIDELMPSAQGAKNAAVILLSRGREHVSSTGLKWLKRYVKEMREGGNLLIMAEVQPEVKAELGRAGILETIGAENVLVAQPELGATLETAVVTSQKWLATRPATPATSGPVALAAS